MALDVGTIVATFVDGPLDDEMREVPNVSHYNVEQMRRGTHGFGRETRTGTYRRNDDTGNRHYAYYVWCG